MWLETSLSDPGVKILTHLFLLSFITKNNNVNKPGNIYDSCEALVPNVSAETRSNPSSMEQLPNSFMLWTKTETR